jgi:hypothetical protein
VTRNSRSKANVFVKGIRLVKKVIIRRVVLEKRFSDYEKDIIRGYSSNSLVILVIIPVIHNKLFIKDN